MSHIIINEYPLKADSWSDFPVIAPVSMARGAQILEFRNSGCNVTLFALESAFTEKEERNFYLYPLGKIFERPDSTQFRLLGIAGEACNKCVIYERITS